MLREFQMPQEENARYRTVKLRAIFIIETDGSITIQDVTCSEDNEAFVNEFRRSLKMLPKFTPANYKGVLVRQQYTLPLSIRMGN